MDYVTCDRCGKTLAESTWKNRNYDSGHYNTKGCKEAWAEQKSAQKLAAKMNAMKIQESSKYTVSKSNYYEYPCKNLKLFFYILATKYQSYSPEKGKNRCRLTASERKLIRDRTDGRCYLCKGNLPLEGWHVEHVIPFSKDSCS